MFFTFSISTILILFCSKMDQLQLRFRLFKVLSSVSVTPNLSDYAWQLNYVILLGMLNIIILYLLQHTVWPNPYTWSNLIVSVEFYFTKNISQLQQRYCSITLCKNVSSSIFVPTRAHSFSEKNIQIVTEAAHAKILTDCEVWRLFSDLLPQYWERYWVVSCPTRLSSQEQSIA